MRRMVLLLASLVAAVAALQAPAATPARADTYVLLSLTNSPPATGLMDVKDNNNVDGQALWTWNSNGNAIGWFHHFVDNVSSNWPFLSQSLNKQFSGHSVVNFEDAQDSAGTLCAGETGGNAVLKKCTTDSALWVLDGSWDSSHTIFSGDLINVQFTNYTGRLQVLSAAGYGNGDSMYLDPPGTSGDWQKWTFNF